MPVISSVTIKDSQLVGADYGATISIILDRSLLGQGPRLHRHPYDETWVVQEGTVRFQLGDTEYEAGSGDIIIAPPGIPHKFNNQGTERAKLICIHASPTFITEWLE
jgi:mannose-6-phosphate isomerase-like protein (cupin superfamily)